MGLLDFEFVGEEVIMRVHVFRVAASMFAGHEPTESEEMRPRWFTISPAYLQAHQITQGTNLAAAMTTEDVAGSEEESGIPFGEMWLDDRQWFPLLLRGAHFSGEFLFRGHSEIVSFELRETL